MTAQSSQPPTPPAQPVASAPSTLPGATARPATCGPVRGVRGFALLAATAILAGAGIGGLIITRAAITTATPATTPAAAVLGPDQVAAAAADPVLPARPVSAAELAALPQATTWGTIPSAPPDQHPDVVPDGTLLTATATVPIYDKPGGDAIAALPPQQLDGDHQPVGPSTVPVIATAPGWARVLLPTRPNGATGWLALTDPRLATTQSPYLIRVDRSRYSLTLWRGASLIRQWTVAVGVPTPIDGVTQSATPTGRTYVIADVQIRDPSYSPTILPLGLHSSLWETYGGGPATTALHTWTPDPTVYGRAVSHGCIRIPPDALRVLSTTVPIGTPVLIR